MCGTGSAGAGEARRRFTAGRQGPSVRRPADEYEYLFVAPCTLIIRSLPSPEAWNSETVAILPAITISSRWTNVRTVAVSADLHLEAVEYFTGYMADLKKEKIYSKTVMHCMNYIFLSLNRPVCVTEIAAQVKRES